MHGIRIIRYGGLGDVAAAEFAGEFVEEFDEAGEDEAAEVAHAVVVELAGLQGDEDDLLEGVGRGIVSGADGEGGLAHAARPVNERAPGAGVGIKGVGDLPQLVLAAKEGLEGGEVVGDVGLEDGGAGGDGLGVVILRVTFVEGEAFEYEGGELLGRLVVEFDEAGGGREAVGRCVLEAARPRTSSSNAHRIGDIGVSGALDALRTRDYSVCFDQRSVRVGANPRERAERDYGDG